MILDICDTHAVIGEPRYWLKLTILQPYAQLAIGPDPVSGIEDRCGLADARGRAPGFAEKPRKTVASAAPALTVAAIFQRCCQAAATAPARVTQRK